METGRIHPLVVGLAGAVLVLSAVAIAAVTGVLPTAASKVTPGGSENIPMSAPPSAPPRPASTPAQSARSESPPAARPTTCDSCGVIESIHAAEVEGAPSGLGAVAGGLAGAVVGNQFGRGTGRTLMTIAGAAGGAYAGNSIEKSTKKHTVFRITVRLDNGTTHTLTLAQQPPFAVGERVRIVNGNSLERA